MFNEIFSYYIIPPSAFWIVKFVSCGDEVEGIKAMEFRDYFAIIQLVANLVVSLPICLFICRFIAEKQIILKTIIDHINRDVIILLYFFCMAVSIGLVHCILTNNIHHTLRRTQLYSLTVLWSQERFNLIRSFYFESLFKFAVYY